jgi:hypothetical protein
MPIGAGFAPAGFSLAGYGVIDTAEAPALIPLPDPTTGQSQTGRLLSVPVPGGKGMDYSFTPDGRLQGMPTVRQMVLIAVEDLDFSSIQTKTPNYRSEVARIVAAALAPLTTQKLLLLKAVVILDSAQIPGMNVSASICEINWFDLTTGQNGQPVQVPLA